MLRRNCLMMELLKHLGVKHLVVISGVSMGGYQSLEFMVTFPDFVDGVMRRSMLRRLSMFSARWAKKRTTTSSIPSWGTADPASITRSSRC